VGEHVGDLVDDLFRREFAHLVSALVRLLGPAHLALAEDVVHDALVTAMQAWRMGAPDDPKAWILQVAKRRAIDALRRDRRRAPLPGAAREDASPADGDLEAAVDAALSPEADAGNQLAMMFAICDDALGAETHVTLILRLLCGFSAAEIARAFLVDVPTIDRRLHRGRGRLRELGSLCDVGAMRDAEAAARQPSIEQALYLLFNEGYHGSDEDTPLAPAMCADALRLVELLLSVETSSLGARRGAVHALAALFCFHAARLSTRLDDEGVLVPLADQDRSRWDRVLLERGILHLGASAAGQALTRWHLEAGIAFEHTRAASVAETDWPKIAAYYDALLALAPGPIVALNRGVALAELHGLQAGRDDLERLRDDPRLARYSFFWAALADLARRAGRASEARPLYRRAIDLARSRAERASYERRLAALEN
jgi:RNA polymerase sigma factor (sigma-70 family)